MLLELGPGLIEVNEKAQNRLAYALMQAERDQAKSSLDRPTPYSISSIAYKKVGATSFSVGGLTVPTPAIPGAGVFVGDLFGRGGASAEHYLGVQIFGGKTAGPRGSELALQALNMMPSGTVWVPAPGTGLDAYGNVSGTAIRSMLADLRANGRRGENFVVIGQPGDERAVFTQVAGEWHPFLYFIQPATYTDRYGFYERADAEVAQQFPGIMNEELDRALERIARI